MKILLVHNYYQLHGGENVAVDWWIEALKRIGHDVILYTRRNQDIHEYNPVQKAAFALNTLYSRQTVQEIHDLLQRTKPDVVQLRNIFPLISPSIYYALDGAGVPWTQFISNFRYLCPNGVFYTHNERCERCIGGNMMHAIRFKCYRDSYVTSALYAATIMLHRQIGTLRKVPNWITPSEFVAKKMGEAGIIDIKRIAVIPNFMSEALPPKSKYSDRKPYVLYIGRLSIEKGIDVAIRAIAGLPFLTLKIAGDGPLEESLKVLANKEAPGKVEFLGSVSGQRKAELLNQAMAMVLPSVNYEVFPLTIMESFASSTPVVASNLGSMPYLVRHGETGLLFKPGEASDLRAQLLFLIKNETERERLGEKAREVAERTYAPEVGLKRLIDYYETLVAAGVNS